MSKLYSRPSRNIILLHELPFLDNGLVETIKKSFETAKGHGFFGIHTIFDSTSDRPEHKKQCSVFSDPDKREIPKIIMLQGHEEHILEWRINDKELVGFSTPVPLLLITGEPDAPNPIPGNWPDILATLAGFGLKTIHLYGFEAETVPLDVWDAFWAERAKHIIDKQDDAQLIRLMREWMEENPLLKTQPVLKGGCVLGALVELLDVRKKHGFEVIVEHDLLMPGYDEQNVAMWRRLLKMQ